MNKKLQPNLENGYTIIETMIAVSLFLVVIMFGTTALLNANLLHKKSADMRSIIDNLSFIMDDISRNLRVGYDYACFVNSAPSDVEPSSTVDNPKSCNSGWGVAFENSELGNQSNPSDQWFYIINNGKVYKTTAGPYSGPGSSYVQLTPDEVTINDVASEFTVIGAESKSSGDLQQPLVTIRLVGEIDLKGVITPFSLQTSVSQRIINNY